MGWGDERAGVFPAGGGSGEGGGFGWIEQSGEEVHIPTGREQMFGQAQGLK